MIYVGLGANLPSPDHGTPEATLAAALERFSVAGVTVVARSPWYRSAPVPRSGQPWFVNGVAAVETALAPGSLLSALHGIEAAFGRVRRERWGPRIIDLDLIAFHDEVLAVPGGLEIPHPRMHERAFVLRPLADLAPDWRHPVLGRGVGGLIAGLDGAQEIERFETPAPGVFQTANAGKLLDVPD